MRKWSCVPMIMLLLLLTACGEAEKETGDAFRRSSQEMTGCALEATVRCDQEGAEWEAVLACAYVPEGESTVEVLAPDAIAGVRAVFRDADWRLEYEEVSLNAGTLSEQEISPALCLPRLMDALREGWLLEENEEQWGEIPCFRVSLDQSGEQGGKIISTLWLRMDDGTPLRGEIAVDGEIILTAEFTKFSFYDTIDQPDENASG